jgi:GT2 family glycosyltransferase
MEEKIAVLILFFNKLEETVNCIESFLPSGQPIYVLNNGSDLFLWNEIKNRYCDSSQVTLFHSEINLGVSRGRNVLISQTKEPWLLIVDNDTYIKNRLNWAVEFFNYKTEVQSDLEVFTLYIYNVHENAYVKPIHVELNNRKVSIITTDNNITNCFPGTGSIIRRSVFDRHGLFDEAMFVGFEDYEYALRCILSKHGALNVHHSSSIELIHDHKFQKTDIDKNAVKIRYSDERLETSYKSLVEKYNIEFDHDWQWWTKTQIVTMTVPRWKQILQNLVTKFLR